ncbi:hypothetical protein [Ferrovibrio sp.]|uniref:hypothetical protein n=1 Tax=Ferrovibrio sp. TaxID=1917215 RepID=UPI000CBC4F14|nr:hypothetical protein [Ferrovibrio sp.]PJI40196.1 MAG: hypothetical protein CTR53_11010 [Ferrovibrio sp.]
MNAVFKPPTLQQRNIAALRSHLAQVQSARLAEFIHYMLSIHPADRLPSRGDFDPLNIPGLLSSVVLVTVHREDARTRFKMKVVGQDVIDASPVKIGQRYLDEIIAELPGASVIVDTRQKVLDTGVAYLRQGPPTMPFTFKMTVLEYVHCPLAEDGETIDQIVSFFSYRGHRGAPTSPSL